MGMRPETEGTHPAARDRPAAKSGGEPGAGAQGALAAPKVEFPYFLKTHKVQRINYYKIPLEIYNWTDL